MQATTRARARRRGGLIRRFRRRDDEHDLTPSPATDPADIIDIRTVTESDLQRLILRMDKLEAGVRLMVETMKRTYGDLASSIETLAQQLDVADARNTVERIVAEEIGPLTTSIRDLSDTIQRLPHTLAAGMDDIGLRVDTGRWKLERTLTEGLESLLQATSTVPGSGTEAPHSEPSSTFAPRPFELEPVELQFGGTTQTG